MKKYILFALTTLTGATLHAQTVADAVRYSNDNMNGTARFRGMSGAFGALGGDVSALMVNPAGSAVFNYNSGTVSLTNYNINNNAKYYGTGTSRNDNSFELNQIGGVWVFNNINDQAKWKKITLGLNYENTNNLDNSIRSRGISPQDNLSDYFLAYAQGVPLNVLDNAFFDELNYADQQAYLGYNAYIFNPVNATDPANTSYIASPNITGSNGYFQEHSITSNGFNGKIALNFATQYSNWLYLGMNLNLHFIDHTTSTSFFEEYNSPAATGLQSVRFNNELYTYGGGFSLNVGAIAKVTEAFRLGLSYESPTWYNLQDEIRQSIVSECVNCNGPGSRIFITDPGLTFITEDYSLRTPSKWTGSAAYVFGKTGLLSIDAALKDYNTAKFTSNGFGNVNAEIDDQLDVAAEIRVGGELRYKNVSLRGGYRFEQSPYKNSRTIGDLHGFSTGLGFAFGNSRLDLAYSYFRRTTDVDPLNSSFFNSNARVRGINNNITLSYTIDL
ncbi:hypothetical protein CHU92_15120 [Flavobacterium cyanobacteriorum]|uniref:Transporter n=1 Tax=Flavobacterium cyanobacteriorum TaxID=2022802 RepID=A0A255YRY6_9FLAO|nr:outer membrane protein transport protein [Flavobacterium cyanobacteriorum]OYQ31972.1 hypothetical protein CHU92_15120 [Flavobacterium cyanobacteriorum]